MDRGGQAALNDTGLRFGFGGAFNENTGIYVMG
jgi:hypothetical protein